MNWQVAYALQNIDSGHHLRNEAIRISKQDKPDVVAVISASETITADLAKQYHREYPEMDFLCGYRKSCIWEGGAIKYLGENRVGWGSFGTLGSAVLEGKANSAAHKDFFFSDRLIRQIRTIASVEREFDRIHTVTLVSGRKFRIGMILEYEPTADTVRSLWERFGPVDIAWNINPNGDPTRNAIEAGQELGCEVVKWDELKALLKKA